MKFRKYTKMLFLLLAAVGMAGCVQDYGGSELPVPENGNEVTFTVTVPGQQIPTTRSIADGAGESTIAFIDLLIFDMDGEFSRHVPGTNITVTAEQNYKVTFKAALTVEANDQTVVVLANVPTSTIETLTEGDTKLAALSKLTHTSEANQPWKAASGDYTPIPMYGEVSIGAIATTTVALTRMLARVDVVNNATSDFTLTDVYVVNYNTKGYIAQAWDDSDGTLLSSLPSEPMVPDGANPLGAGVVSTESDALHYEGSGMTGKIYLYEALANPNDPMAENEDHTNAICLIVKGTYLGSDYYYRIDFTAGSGATTASETREYMPVYRNHLYTFDIEAVNGVGYSSFDDALKSFGVLNNLKTKLHVVDQTGVTNMVFNGQHYIGLGNAVTLSYESGDEANVPCVTNYWEGWEIEKITYEPNSGDNWVTTIPAIGATPDPTIKKIKLTTGSENTGSSNRVAYVHLKAGRLTHQLKVTQQFLPVFSVTPSLTFGYSATAQSATIESNISWSVASKPEWCSTVTPSSGTGNGSLSANVEALGLNALSVTGYMRSGNIDFSNTDGISLVGESITVTQYAPVLVHASNTLPTGSEAISPTGNSYTVNVSTNLQGWGIKVYTGADNSGAVLVSKAFGTSTEISSNAAAVSSNVSVTIPVNSDPSARTLAVYLYCSEFSDTANEILVGTWTQQWFNGGENHVVYFLVDGTLAVGKWGVDVKAIANLAYFKFGSVVGMDSSGDWSSSIKYNPTTTTSWDAYDDIPVYTSEDYSAGLRNISANNYHTLANVKAGKGDPCRLAGLTQSEIQAMTTDDELYDRESGWRLATAQENAWFVGGPKTSAWQPWPSPDENYYYQQSTSTIDGDTYANIFETRGGNASDPNIAWFPVVQGESPNQEHGLPLPCNGYRYAAGHCGGIGKYGGYACSTPNSDRYQYHMSLLMSWRVTAWDRVGFAMGNTARCVQK